MQSEKLGKRIRQYREKCGMSQEVLAEKLGLSITAISNIERGRNYPKLEIFIQIANILDVSSDLLLCDLVNRACETKSNELCKMLENQPLKEKKKIYRVIEAMTADID